jgi:hypothetical protein
VATMAPPPPTDFSPRPCCGDGADALSPKLTDRLARGTRAHDLNTVHGTRAEELHNTTGQYAVDNKTTKLRPASRSREATPMSSKEVPSDITVQNAKDGARGGKKRCKQYLQGVVAMVDGDGGDNEEAGGSGVACVTTAVGSNKC